MTLAKRPIREILYSLRFERSYKKLSDELKDIVETKENIIRSNIFDPRLRTHKLSGGLKDLWSLSVAYSHRIIFEFLDRDSIIFVDIGDHRVYQ